MCRMLLIDKKGIEHVENNSGGLVKLLRHLVISGGGHGNGYSLIRNNSTVTTVKGVNLHAKQASENILKELSDIRFVIFHTRFASIGIINNKNCHPFIADKNIICMNGTESAFKDLYNANMTDTETILQFITRQKLDLISSLQELRSAFIGYTNKKVFTIKNDRDLQILKTQGIIIASEFPYDYYVNGNVYNAPALYQEGDQVNYNQLSLAQPNFYLTRKKVI